MFWSKVFPTKYNMVIAVCDEEIIDKELKHKDFKIKVSKNFYGGKLVDEMIVKKLLDKATIGNLMGKKIVSLAEKSGFITKENIIFINGIPHAQFVKI